MCDYITRLSHHSAYPGYSATFDFLVVVDAEDFALLPVLLFAALLVVARLFVAVFFVVAVTFFFVPAVLLRTVLALLPLRPVLPSVAAADFLRVVCVFFSPSCPSCTGFSCEARWGTITSA